jgi:3-isopropylmalate/(R)-2-methylmalate dehydratase small subunit
MSGRAFVFGDNIDTDVLAPGRYMKAPVEELARHCMEAIAPEFAQTVRAGDIVVAGRNFGMGSSREQAAQALKILGVSAVVAKSFGGIFLRNALNLGLPVMVCAATQEIRQDDRLTIDLPAGRLINETTATTLAGEPLPDFLLDMLADGGLVPYLEKRLAAKRGVSSQR